MEAPDERLVRLHLRRLKITPIKIKPKSKGLTDYIPFLRPKVKAKELVVFTRQLATMINAGLPLVQALDALAHQQENKTFKEIIQNIKADVEGGLSLTEALKKHKCFDNLYTNMVQAGEMGGNLDEVLMRLATYMEKSLKLKKKIKGALTYPAIVVSISVIVVTIILLFVIPVFEKMFSDFGKALPLPTQIVIAISNFVKNYILAIIGGIILGSMALKRYYATEKGRRQIDALILRVPVFGPLIRKVAVAKFARTLGTLINSGVSIIEALKVAAATAGNKVVEEAILNVRANITEGRSIADPLEESGIFPHMVVQMVAVGESTGALDTMLNKVAEFFEDEVDATVEALTSMIEPFMIVFLGGTIGGIIVAMYLPIFQIGDIVSGH
ncbi:type II secretion system F family protein [Thermosulfuriphilus ammonigenes]|uniref:Type II secretion system F family protein n=2 Tax=Thermosulfuriphilus ammonigenes TaxID=1936021 RepID=A0A6G7PYX4_9BACT|nr:type II secretion system F family protein [Thermosulfuriphilus ammonigenes]